MRDWEKEFTDMGAFWFHDGHPERPYVRLTTDAEDGRARISNGYFNGSVVQQHAVIFGLACVDLITRFRGEMRPIATEDAFAIAAEKGGIALSQRIGEAFGIQSAYAEKQPDGSLKFERFSFPPGAAFLLAEDTITSGGTLKKLVAAARRASSGCIFYPRILALCSRGEHGVSFDDMGVPIIALVNRPMLTWVEGENPFTKDANGGAELVPPVKAKTHWHELTRAYP